MDWWLHLLPVRMLAVWFGLIVGALLLLCLAGVARLAYEGAWLMALLPAAGAASAAAILRVVVRVAVVSLDEATSPPEGERSRPLE